MREAKLPLAYRDSCAGLLIPLNRCRQEEYYLPWKCSVRSPTSRKIGYLPADLDCDSDYRHRTSDMATKNANTKSSRSG